MSDASDPSESREDAAPALRSSAASAFADLSSEALAEEEATADKSAGEEEYARNKTMTDPADETTPPKEPPSETDAALQSSGLSLRSTTPPAAAPAQPNPAAVDSMTFSRCAACRNAAEVNSAAGTLLCKKHNMLINAEADEIPDDCADYETKDG